MAQTAQINIKVDGKQAEGSVNQLNQSLQQTEQTTGSLRAQLRQVTQELQNLEPGSARFTELSQRAGELRDTIQDTNAVINATAGNVTENLARGLGNVAQIGVQGFQAITAGAQILGIEGESLQKTMVTLQATMAFTQSLEFFAGLGDKITEIKAGFQGLLQTLGLVNTSQKMVAVSAGATAVAETAQGTAALGAATSTGVLSAALNALPFVAIVSAIGLAVGALMSWNSQSKQAAKEEKKRNEELEKMKQKQEEQSNYLAKETQQFTSLIYQLKATNAGSKERSALITQINGKYGTILKNMGDEVAFQNQLNVAVAQYIALSYNKYKIQKNEEEIGKLNAKRFEAEKEQNKLMTQYYKERAEAGDRVRIDNPGQAIYETTLKTSESLGNFRRRFGDFDAAFTKTEKIMMTTNNQLEAYGGNVLKTQAEIDKMTKELMPNSTALNTNTGSVNTNTDANDENAKALERRRKQLDELQSLMEREKTATEQLTELNIDREKISENVYTKRTKREQEIVKLEMDNQDFRNQLIEGAIEREIELIDEKFVNGTMSEQEYINEVSKIRTNGNDYLLDIEKELISRKEELTDEEIQMKKDGYEQMRIDAINSTELTEIEMSQMTLEFNKQREIRDIEMSKMTEEEKQKEILKIKEDYLTQEKYWLEKSQRERLEILDEQEKVELKNFDGTIEEKDAIHKKYEKERLKVTQETLTGIETLEQESVDNTERTFQQRMELISEYVSQYGEQFMNVWGGINDLLNQQSENRISQFQNDLDVELHNIQQLYDSKMLTEEEYNAQKLQLESKTQEQIKNEKRKQFQRDKAYNIANAVMTGAIAVLNGLATMPLVPLGLIMAGVAGAMTGVQIATISQQQFTAARGGIVPGNGLPGDVDSVNAKLAPGEAVINSRSTSMFGNTLSLINQAGGGIPLVPDTISQGSSGSGTIFVENQPQQVRAYVVETEITDTQRRVGRIERSVEF